jgi:glucose/arabinose dehydrogenase
VRGIFIYLVTVGREASRSLTVIDSTKPALLVTTPTRALNTYKMKYLINLLIVITCCAYTDLSAQRVHALVPNIQVDSLLQAKNGASKIAYDQVRGHLYYSISNGDIYEVYIPGSGNASDTLRYTSTDHGITMVQGMIIRDSVMYLCGNQWLATTGIGKVVKGKLQPNGSRVWTAIATSQPYPSSEPWGDHGFAGVTIDPAGTYIFVSSGARTHLGEIRTNSGAWPNKREVPMTCRMFRFPINATNIILPNDSVALDASGYVYLWGNRNAYSMAWDANSNLFAIDNAGERDDPEELNWLRPNRHYGYPWRMGGNTNPLAHSPYDVSQDLLVNHNSSGYINGWFADNPGFAAVPPGTTFTEPIRNYGPDADFFKDSVTGTIKNASDLGSYISSFTPHRSPLGLVIDKDSLLDTPYRGDAFLTSFMPGGDSSGFSSLSPWGGPVCYVDPVRDLLHVKLTYNSSIDNYTMNVYRIVEGFYLPTDATLVGNVLYVIENANAGEIWRITMPNYSSLNNLEKITEMKVYPNPGSGEVDFKFKLPASLDVQLSIYDVRGRKVFETTDFTADPKGGTIHVEMNDWADGVYVYKFKADAEMSVGKIIKAGK